MQTVSADFLQGKKVLLRMDLDVPFKQVGGGGLAVEDDFRLESGLDTLDLCLQHAASVIVMGHVGRPEGKEVPELSVKPIVDWFEEKFAHVELPEGMLHIMENLRFEPGEDGADPNYARELIACADPNNQGGVVFVNEAFSSHHPAASTTVLPTLLPHAAGLRFAHEVETLLSVRQNPKKPLVVIIGGAKLEDKLAVLNYFSKIADAVLVGGKLPAEIREKNFNFPANVMVGKMNDEGTDLAPETIGAFENVIKNAKQVLWAGPVGKYEDDATIFGTKALAEAMINSGAETIVGGGDTITALDKLKLLNRIHFVSVGGGAMLKLLETGTLLTIEALN